MASTHMYNATDGWPDSCCMRRISAANTAREVERGAIQQI